MSTVESQRALSDDDARLTVCRKDPLARMILHTFGAHPWRLFWVIFAVGVICMVILPAINGTLLPQPTFLSSLSDLPSLISFLVVNPFLAVYYVKQLNDIPAVFEDLQKRKVTGHSEKQYKALLSQFDRKFNRISWFIFSLAILMPLWITFIVVAIPTPYSWYHASNIWPWIVYLAVQMIYDSAAIAYLIRFAITTQCLRTFLDGDKIRPQLFHPDGICGFGSVLALVLTTVITGGLTFVESSLLFGGTIRYRDIYFHSPEVFVILIVAVMYLTLVPYLLYSPLRILLRALRTRKHQMVQLLSEYSSRVLWDRVSAPNQDSVSQQETAELLGLDVSAIATDLSSLQNAMQAIGTIPESLSHMLTNSRARLYLATVVPPLFTIGFRIVGLFVNWNQLLQFVRISL